MRFHEALELRWCEFLEKVPAIDSLIRRWGFRFLRRMFLCGATLYAVDFIFGVRRRHFGSNPLRLLPTIWTGAPWRLPYTTRAIRGERRKWFKIVAKMDGDFDDDTPRLPFYTDLPYDYEPRTLPDESPPLPVIGTEYPPGLHLLHNHLNLLSYFPLEDSMEVYKASKLIPLEEDDFLFGVGDADNSFYLVLMGLIKLSINDSEFGLTETRHVGEDEVIFSILKLMDVFFEDESWSKAGSAIAGEKSVVLEVPYSAIRSHLDKNPSQQIPFLMKSMASIRGIYFAGFQDLTGLENNLLRSQFSLPTKMDKIFTPSTFREEAPEPITLDIPKARQALRQFGYNLTDEQFSKCVVGLIPGGTAISRVARITKSVIFLVEGTIEIGIDNRDKNLVKTYRKDGKAFAKVAYKFRPLYQIPPGEFYGGWGILTDCKNTFTARIQPGSKALVVEISRADLIEMWAQDPKILYAICKGLLDRFNELCRQIDFCMGWRAYGPGMAVYREGDKQLSIFLLTHGRLRYQVEPNYTTSRRMELEGTSSHGYYRPGTWFGFVESIASSGYMEKTVIADRFSEVVSFPQMLMKLLLFRFPMIYTKMTEYLAYRIHGEYEYEIVGPFHDQKVDDFVSNPKYSVKKRDHVSVLAVIPLGPDIPAELYCMEIMRYYRKRSRFCNYRDFQVFVKFDLDKENDFELKQWWNATIEGRDCEDVALYVIPANYDKMDLWNTMLVRQADFVHFLGDYTTPQDVPQYERAIVKEAWRASREYVFLHKARHSLQDRAVYKGVQSARYVLCAPKPKNSILWLEKRPWLDIHHHVRFPECAFKYAESNNPEYLEEYHNYVRVVGVDKHSDLGRVGRRLTRENTGIVLGGGGAKGACHIGVLEYIQEMDIPIDYICGVSIGSFVGALLSHNEHRLDPVYKKLRCLLDELKQPMKYIRDLSFPYSSLLRGRSFNEFVKTAFDDARIEDMWTPFFPVTTDISGNHSRIHTSGKLWFYVRASMTLTMVFPPLVDPKDNHLIMDGGYSEILPGEQLRMLGVRYILAIDITDENGMPTFDFGYQCSGLACLIQNLLPLPWPNIPSQLGFWEQINYISATKLRDKLKDVDRKIIYIRPAIELYNGKDFHKLEEMRYMGYYCTRKRFSGYHPCLSLEAVWAIFSSYRHSDTKLNLEE